MAYNLFVTFLLVFCFPVFGPLNSAYIAVLLAIMKLCCCGGINRLVRLYRNTYIKTLIISSLLMTLLCALWTILMGVNDFSLTSAFFSLFVGLWMGIIVAASLNYDNYDNDFFEKLVVNLFVIQAIISIMAFVLPSVREFIHHFQFENDAEKSEEAYAGFRGLAMSGRLFFEFAATCGLIAFVQFKRIINKPTAPIAEYIKLFLIIVCGFFAGRTSMIGTALGFLYLILYKGTIKKKIRIIGSFLLILMSSVTVAVLIMPRDILTFVTEHFLPWVFDLFIKFHESGSTEDSASFNRLNEMYKYVDITINEWIYGSGRYMSVDGGYYKSVDGGFIRHLLYWGVIGSFFSIVYSLLYYIRPYFKSHNRNDKLYILLLLAYTLLVHYKGDLAPTSRFFHVPLVFLMLSYVFNLNPVKTSARNGN